MKKKIISIGLSTSILMGGMAFAAEVENIELKNNDSAVLISQKAEHESNYINYSGKIKSIDKADGILAITVESSVEGHSFKEIVFNISDDTIILSDKTKDYIKSDSLKEGETVELFYGKDAPMTKSLPPMTNAKVLVVRESEEKLPLGVKVDTFNEDLISIDNFLKLNITEDTVIVDKDGKNLSKEDLQNRDLIAFYGPAMTMSIPAQSNAVKVIAIGEKAIETPETPEVPEENTEIKVLDRFIQHASENVKADRTLTNKMYRSGETVMMPIRELGESFGYKVNWNASAKQVELVKGANFLTVNSNQDMYGFAKKIVKLGKASENKNGTVFVPVSFVEEVMQLEMNVDKDGVLNIK